MQYKKAKFQRKGKNINLSSSSTTIAKRFSSGCEGSDETNNCNIKKQNLNVKGRQKMYFIESFLYKTFNNYLKANNSICINLNWCRLSDLSNSSVTKPEFVRKGSGIYGFSQAIYDKK